jgi:hypothetical protein
MSFIRNKNNVQIQPIRWHLIKLHVSYFGNGIKILPFHPFPQQILVPKDLTAVRVNSVSVVPFDYIYSISKNV